MWYRRYVPVSKRRSSAARLRRDLERRGISLTPVVIEGHHITRTFWGDAWCRNLEQYSDFANRLPRGRTYVRNGSVIDLRVEAGQVSALVQGSDLYEVSVKVERTSAGAWATLRKDLTGGIRSLVDLLQGRLSDGVMERICRPEQGLFPAPRDIALSCTCPDWATMCKHVAAVLYGIGSRLDEAPELLFRLRQVDEGELIAEAAGAAGGRMSPAPANALADAHGLEALFGIDLTPAMASPAVRRRRRTGALASGEPGGGSGGAAEAGTEKTGPRKAGPRKTAAKKAGPKKAGPKKAGPRKAGPRKTRTTKAVAGRVGTRKPGAAKRRPVAAPMAAPAAKTKPGARARASRLATSTKPAAKARATARRKK